MTPLFDNQSDFATLRQIENLQAEIARLREREAQLTESNEALRSHRAIIQGVIDRAEAAEARVAELERERDFLQNERRTAEEAHDETAQDVARLEEALREIAEMFRERDIYKEAEEMKGIARRALAHEEEVDMTASPFPQPALESSEKGLFRDREIPARPAGSAHEEEK